MEIGEKSLLCRIAIAAEMTESPEIQFETF